MIKLKKYKPGDKICEHSTKSELNFEFRIKQKNAIESFVRNQSKNDKEYSEKLEIFKNSLEPSIKVMEDEQDNF